MNQSIASNTSTLSNDTLNSSGMTQPSQETLSQSIEQLKNIDPVLNLDLTTDKSNQGNKMPHSLTIRKDGKFFIL